MFKERRKARLAGVRGDCCEVGRDHIFVGHGLKTKNKTNKKQKNLQNCWNIIGSF